MDLTLPQDRPTTKRTTEYALILDAGSSGTRLHAYSYQVWDKKSPLTITPIFKGKVKTEHGIADLKNVTSVKDYLTPFIEDAEKQLKINSFSGNFKEVKLSMLGTAGMRNLRRDNKAGFVEREKAINDFLKNSIFETDGGYRTISGEEEAAFGWIAVNYLLGTLRDMKQSSYQQVGFLEMGGASAQIAFRPHRNELHPEDLSDGDITRVMLGDEVFDLFVKTYDLGSDAAWKEYEKDLRADNPKKPGDTHIFDPDSPRGRKWGDFMGTGPFDPTRFRQKVARVIDRLCPPQNPQGSRLLDRNLIGVLKGRQFVGGANFWYSTRDVFGKDEKGESKKDLFSFAEYEAEVSRTTMLDWPLLRLRLRHDKPAVMGKAWFVAEWVRAVLSDGFGFATTDSNVRNEEDLSFRPYNGPNGDLTWTYGKMALIVTGDKPIEERLGADRLMDEYKNAQVAVLKEKARHWREEARDYLFMIATLRRDREHLDTERIARLEKLTRAACATSWNMDRAAFRVKSEDDGRRLRTEEEQLKEVKNKLDDILLMAKALMVEKDPVNEQVPVLMQVYLRQGVEELIQQFEAK